MQINKNKYEVKKRPSNHMALHSSIILLRAYSSSITWCVDFTMYLYNRWYLHASEKMQQLFRSAIPYLVLRCCVRYVNYTACSEQHCIGKMRVVFFVCRVSNPSC